MSRIPERVVAEMVKEVSVKMNDPSYAQTLVGSWVQSQPVATKYMTAHVKELGGPEAVVSMVFHAQIVATCFLRHAGRIYPAKDAVTTPESFAAMYPRLEEFRTIQARLDPANRLSSSLARRVGILPS